MRERRGGTRFPTPLAEEHACARTARRRQWDGLRWAAERYARRPASRADIAAWGVEGDGAGCRYRAGIAKTVVAAAAVVLLATAVLAAIGWPARSYRDSDWLQYYAGSRAILEGASPWDAAWWRVFYQDVGSVALTAPPHSPDTPPDWTTPYPLWTFVLLLPFALLPLALAAPLFAVLEIAAVLAATYALAATLLPRRAVPLALALVASSQPLAVLIAGGNLTGFAAAAFTVAVVALLGGRPLVAGLLLAACLLKPHVLALAAVALIAGAPAHTRRRLITGAVAGTTIVVLPTLLLRPGWVAEWLAAASRLQDTSFSNATGWTIARPLTAAWLPLSALVVAVCVLAFLVWWWRTRPDVVRLVGAALPVSMLVAPHGWTYDYITLLPTVIVGIGAAVRAPGRVVLPAFAVIVAAAPWTMAIVAVALNTEDLSAALLVCAEFAILSRWPRGSAV